VVVGDQSLDLAKEKVENRPHGEAIEFDAANDTFRKTEIAKADLVISMLPAFMHILVAKDCLEFKKNLLAPSYVSTEVQALGQEVKDSGLLFMFELGLDPGLDHMSAMRMVHQLREQGAKITAFRSYTGGLIAEESVDNPWAYKFTWNPRNVVLAGQGTGQYKEGGVLKCVPYHHLFKSAHQIDVPGVGSFDAYPNRNSLKYHEIYSMQDVPTLLRGTIRYAGFAEAWAGLVDLGLTDDTYKLPLKSKTTVLQFIRAFVPEKLGSDIRAAVLKHLELEGKDSVIEKYESIDLFSDLIIPLDEASPAQVLEWLLLRKWTLKPEDKDFIVMQHDHAIKSYMTATGENATDTAMSRLVGLPVAIFAKYFLNGNIKATGIHRPITPELYNPILDELEEMGVTFVEHAD